MSTNQTAMFLNGNKQKNDFGQFPRNRYAKNLRNKRTKQVVNNAGSVPNFSATGAAQLVKSGAAQEIQVNIEAIPHAAVAVTSLPAVTPVPVFDISAISNGQQLSVKQKIEQLNGDYKSFVNYHDGQVKTIKHVLYELLAKVYAVYAEMRTPGSHAEQLCKDLDKYMIDAGLKFGAKTTLLSKILGCVFGKNEPKKTHGYYTVISFAHEQGCKPDQMVKFIEKFGGIQAIRKQAHAKNKNKNQAGKQPAPTRDQKLANARGELAANNECVIDDPVLGQLIPQGCVATQILLVATPMADGTVVINAAVADADAVEKALLAYAAAKAKAEKATKAEDGGTNDAEEPSAEAQEDMAEMTA